MLFGLSVMIELIAQFGAAGLIGAMWLIERRLNQKRDRQLDAAHHRIIATRRDRDLLLRAIRDNTRAITRLEHSQHELITLLGSLTRDVARR